MTTDTDNKLSEQLLSRRYSTQIERRRTCSVKVGNIYIGSDHPVSVQSMINDCLLYTSPSPRDQRG